MALDHDLFHMDKGGNPTLICDSQRECHKDVSLVDKVIEIDEKWRKENSEKEAPQKTIEQASATEEKLMIERDSKLAQIGNLIHDSVAVSIDEANGVADRTFGDTTTKKKYSHRSRRFGFDLNNKLEVVQYANKKSGSATPLKHRAPTVSTGSPPNSVRSRRFGFDLNNKLEVVQYANKKGGSATPLKPRVSTTSTGSPSVSTVNFIPPSAPAATVPTASTSAVVGDGTNLLKSERRTTSLAGDVIENGDSDKSITAAQNFQTQPVKAKKRCVTWKRLSDGEKY